MLIKQFNEGEPFRCAGNDFVMLLPREESGACEVVLQMVAPGGSTPPNRHDTFQQVYLIWSGLAEIHIGTERRSVIAPAVALIPSGTEHWVRNLSAENELHYLYISIWSGGIPPEEMEGG